jgi:hypothetical protein
MRHCLSIFSGLTLLYNGPGELAFGCHALPVKPCKVTTRGSILREEDVHTFWILDEAFHAPIPSENQYLLIDLTWRDRYAAAKRA